MNPHKIIILIYKKIWFFWSCPYINIVVLASTIKIFMQTRFLSYTQAKHTRSHGLIHTERWERKVVEKKHYFHCLRQRKQDLEVHIRCLLPQSWLIYVCYGFTGWLTSQELESKEDGLGMVCSWRSYCSVCTGYSLSLVVLRLFTITLSKKDSQIG